MTTQAGLGQARSKYGSKATYVDNIRFASKREAARYSELVLMQAAGAITNLECQVRYALHVWPNSKPVGVYVADFVYVQDRVLHVEDAKGFRTPLYRWKRKHFETEYAPVRIEEV